MVEVVNGAVEAIVVPEGPKFTTLTAPPTLYVTVAEGVPVSVNVELVPLQIGDTGVTVALILEEIVTEKFNGAVQAPTATCVKERTTPAGQVVPKLKLLGPKLADPEGLKLKGIPAPVAELLQETSALGLPEIDIIPFGPGQIVADEVKFAKG